MARGLQPSPGWGMAGSGLGCGSPSHCYDGESARGRLLRRAEAFRESFLGVWDFRIYIYDSSGVDIDFAAVLVNNDVLLS